MSALFVSQVEITDMEAFQEYLSKSKELAGKAGAELLFRGMPSRIINGEPHSHQLLVIAKFPSMEAINAWHDSAEYQELVPLRERGSKQLIVAYEEAS